MVQTAANVLTGQVNATGALPQFPNTSGEAQG